MRSHGLWIAALKRALFLAPRAVGWSSSGAPRAGGGRLEPAVERLAWQVFFRHPEIRGKRKQWVHNVKNRFGSRNGTASPALRASVSLKKAPSGCR